MQKIKYYHATLAKNLSVILAEGLRPDKCRDEDEDVPVVFLARDIRSAQMFMPGFVGGYCESVTEGASYLRSYRQKNYRRSWILRQSLFGRQSPFHRAQSRSAQQLKYQK